MTRHLDSKARQPGLSPARAPSRLCDSSARKLPCWQNGALLPGLLGQLNESMLRTHLEYSKCLTSTTASGAQWLSKCLWMTSSTFHSSTCNQPHRVLLPLDQSDKLWVVAMTDQAESEILFFGVLTTILILLSQGFWCKFKHMYKMLETWGKKSTVSPSNKRRNCPLLTLQRSNLYCKQALSSTRGHPEGDYLQSQEVLEAFPGGVQSHPLLYIQSLLYFSSWCFPVPPLPVLLCPFSWPPKASKNCVIYQFPIFRYHRKHDSVIHWGRAVMQALHLWKIHQTSVCLQYIFLCMHTCADMQLCMEFISNYAFMHFKDYHVCIHIALNYRMSCFSGCLRLSVFCVPSIFPCL